MLYEFIQFMKKRYRIPKRPIKNGTSREIGFIGYGRHRAQTNNIKHKTEH